MSLQHNTENKKGMDLLGLEKLQDILESNENKFFWICNENE